MASSGVVVIVPVFNRAALVVQALDSVAAQTCLPDRLIVVDDGSTDGSAKAVSDWLAAKRLPFECRLISQENRGAPAARNRAIGEARDCPLIAFLDSDDLWPADYLARMTAALDAHRDAVAVTCDHRIHNVADGAQELVPATPFDGDITARLFHMPMPLPSCTVVRSEAFHRAGGFNENYRQGLEDVELSLCMSMLGPWRPVAGEAVTRRIETQGTYGGPMQLSMQHIGRRDASRAVVDLFDRFLFDLGGAAKLPRESWAGPMARLWAALAISELNAGRAGEAAACLMRAESRGIAGDATGAIAAAWKRLAKQAQAAGDRRAAAMHYRRSWRFDRRRVDRLLRSLWLRVRS